MQPKMKTTLYISIILMIILEIRMMNCESGLGSNKQLHFVLVHGAGHGGWCWYKIRSLLEAAGHKVTCLDLKCSGIEPTHFNTVFTFDDYNQPLTTFMSSLSPHHKVILVGHSAGGSSVTDMIQKFADKVHMAIYVAAIMVNNIGNLASTEDYISNQLGDFDAYEFICGLGPDQPPTGVMVKPELRRQVLYNESPVEDFTLASMLLRPSPARALASANVVQDVVVPRVFIRTMKDKLFKPEHQEDMIKKWPPSKVLAIDESDHCPFFSAPDVLFALLLEAAISIMPLTTS
ncbi:pheophorbidase-like [Humulus lupulus]|uniref:pheophorbidase-like n=1 Tax=Humulus lupulus TaxID=3486 RepID=UPI002B418428|nr:pheophorbidase-like [Humulus lupulus]